MLPWSMLGVPGAAHTTFAPQFNPADAVAPTHNHYPVPRGRVGDTNWEQRHEDAVKAEAKYYGLLERRVKLLEQTQMELIEENKLLEQKLQALAQSVENLTRHAERLQVRMH